MATAINNRIDPYVPAPAPDSAGELHTARFIAELVSGGLTYVAHDRFAGSITAAQVATLGEPLVLRVARKDDVIEAVIRLASGVVCLMDTGYGSISIEAAAREPGVAKAVVEDLRKQYFLPPPPDRKVNVAFWSQGPHGGVARNRAIDVPDWPDVRANYGRGVAATLDTLMHQATGGPPLPGRLLVWRGPPGTGKTWALRALAGAWRKWCSMQYVLDPFTLFGRDPSYLVDLLTRDDDDDRWRLIVLEDAGELVCVDAGGGLALAPLLNVTDGLLGQGTRALVLITTNEPVGRLHPAIRRPGRCLCDLEFGTLSQDEATTWLREHEVDHVPAGPLSLSELFALHGAAGDTEALTAIDGRSPFGFGRALSKDG